MPREFAPRNHLLAALPAAAWEQVRPHLQEASLAAGQVLVEADEPFARLYFPTMGVISNVATFADGPTAEMATVGREGMAGVEVVLGSPTALSRHLVQVPGLALAVRHDAFRRLAEDIPAFRRLLLAYAQAFLAQVLQSVACNGVHSVEQRAARWLLMTRDRSEGDRFPLTQEFLAEMLGVSRPAVNLVARTLQQAGLIRYSCGAITILDRAGLEEISCECYGVIQRQQERLLRRVTGSG